MKRSVSAGMRSVLFSSSTSAVLAAAHSAALAVVMREPELAARTLRMSALLRERLEAAGYSTSNSASQIISIFFNGDESCDFYGALREQKILTSVFVPPAVPNGISLARFSVYSELTEDDIEYIAHHTINVLRGMDYENWSRR